jgi:CheY-like chemotaxis protein
MQNSKKVLIVEDERPLAHALELKLQNEGYSTAVARSGQEALDAVQTDRYDVMLLDLIMPGIDGFQVLQQLTGSPNRPTTIFVLSNLSQREDEDRVIALGAKKYFIKSNTSLSTIVEEVKAA